MTNSGVVTRVYENKAEIRFIKESACSGNCSSCGACVSKPIDIIVENILEAKTGDKVIIETGTNKILLTAFLIYILPLCILLTIYFCLFKYFGNTVSISIGIIAFVLSFFIAQKYCNKNKYEFKMIRIL